MRKTFEPRKCGKCGKEFVPNRLNRVHCFKCVPIFWYKNRVGKNRCSVCGRETFGYTVNNSDKIYCSFCLSRQQKLRKAIREQKNLQHHYCSECHSWIKKSEYVFNNGLCDSCYQRKKGEKAIINE
jgi:hypothetical protein